jgi:flavin reductase (DIM6/NTAB) family NADH-FMN oxidoreductase RutF
MLGLDATSKTPQNILRTGQCVLNLTDHTPTMVAAVNNLARTTGTAIVPPGKQTRGYSSVPDKWTRAALTPLGSDLVEGHRILECPVQMECELVARHDMFANIPDALGAIMALEVVVRRVHIHENLRMKNFPNRIDPDKWQPMIMNFQELYGVSTGKLGASVLGEIDEELYR